MKKNEFIAIRKKLGKTQKDLSELLGISLKAISSYEQGWRNIPGHVERQLLYLAAKKSGAPLRDCWDVLNCPDEVKQQCPAWEFKSGKLCWFINGTICNCQAKKDWQDKMIICRSCPVFKAQFEL
jgi:transcriptional regulator with XRE-family HTH domain